MSSKQTGEGLRRVVGISGLTLNIVNFTIGAGIFVLPAVVGISLGSYSLWAYLFCGAMLATIMLCYAEIGSKVTSTGGSYAYVEAAFGTFAGFIVNWLFVFAWGVFASAALMNIIADSLAIIFPVFTSIWMRGSFIFHCHWFYGTHQYPGCKAWDSFSKTCNDPKINSTTGYYYFWF